MRNKYYGHKYTAHRSNVVTALRQGKGVRGAAEILGCSYGTVIHMCKVLSIKLGGQGRKQIIIARSRLLKYQKGYSWDRISNDLGHSVGLIRRMFKLHALVKRDERSKNANHPCEL